MLKTIKLILKNKSIGQSSEKNKGKGEDLSVEELIRKLHDRGTKVKILKEDEENI